MVSREEVGESVFQLTPVEKYRHEEGEAAFCETLVNSAVVIPIMLANQENKTRSVKKAKEVGSTLILRSV